MYIWQLFWQDIHYYSVLNTNLGQKMLLKHSSLVRNWSLLPQWQFFELRWLQLVCHHPSNPWRQSQRSGTCVPHLPWFVCQTHHEKPPLLLDLADLSLQQLTSNAKQTSDHMRLVFVDDGMNGQCPTFTNKKVLCCVKGCIRCFPMQTIMWSLGFDGSSLVNTSCCCIIAAFIIRWTVTAFPS